MDKDQLAALDRAARESIGNDSDGLAVGNNMAFVRALVNAYRTGKLVLIDDGAVSSEANTTAWQKWNRENGPEQDWCARAHFDAGWDAALSALGGVK